jgi:hypothetical protein
MKREITENAATGPDIDSALFPIIIKIVRKKPDTECPFFTGLWKEAGETVRSGQGKTRLFSSILRRIPPHFSAIPCNDSTRAEVV